MVQGATRPTEGPLIDWPPMMQWTLKFPAHINACMHSPIFPVDILPAPQNPLQLPLFQEFLPDLLHRVVSPSSSHSLLPYPECWVISVFGSLAMTGQDLGYIHVREPSTRSFAGYRLPSSPFSVCNTAQEQAGQRPIPSHRRSGASQAQPTLASLKSSVSWT